MSDKRSGVIETVMDGVTYAARYHLADGMLHLNVDGYSKTTSRPLPQVSLETNAMFCLRQFVRTFDPDDGVR
jgi:hypothetical protein